MGQVILVIGNLRRWAGTGRGAPDLDGFEFVPFEDLTLDLLDALRPDLILSALVGETHDAIDLARRLRALGYAGRYRALTRPLPNPEAVLEEVRLVAPDLDFDLLVLNLPRPN